MALPENLQHFMDEPIKVLDDGHVQLIDVFGDDDAIVQAARVSYGEGTKRSRSDRHLIRYLMRHRHSTPFEMAEIKIRVRVPMDCWRQWIRHRTASVNEYSTRYSQAIQATSRATTWRAQSSNNKQGSLGEVTAWPEGFEVRLDDDSGDHPLGGWVGSDYYCSPAEYLTTQEASTQLKARAVYEERLQFGVAREVARKDLPLSTYTEAYWKVDLHNLFHFLSLRMDPHAQLEIRSFANAIAEIVKVWVPWAWEAFEDYRLNGMFLTKFEVAGLKTLLDSMLDYTRQSVPTYSPDDMVNLALADCGLPKIDPNKKEPREITEFKAKLRRMLKD